jgi:hypothetical protein
MELVWRLQGTAEFETHASWHGVAQVIVDSAAEDWPGYVWVQIDDRLLRDRWFLIRADDVDRAREGELVEIFVPGLFGCGHPADVMGYIDSQVGGISESDELFVALYEGDVVYTDVADDGIVFRPVKLLEVTPAHAWYEQMRAQLGWD